METNTYTATYHSHETTDVMTITQEFDGDPAYIAENYFRIYGDTLGKLETPEGVVVYDNMAAMNEWAEYMGDCC